MPHFTSPSPSPGPAALALASKILGQLSKSGKVTVPTYARKNVKQGIVHIGVGGFHRAHLAAYMDTLLQQQARYFPSLPSEWSICGVGLQPFDAAMRDTLAAQDNLYTLVSRSAHNTTAHVVGSITNYLFAPDEPQAVITKLASPDTKIVSLTITESGYYYNENTHELEVEHPNIQFDLHRRGDGHGTFEAPRTTFGYLAAALGRRFRSGLRPFTVLSCDNMQRNGHITGKMLISFAKLRDPEMAAWLQREGAFPNSMVDRITPRTLASDIDDLEREFGVVDKWPVVTEPWTQWVLEDNFADGRPAFETIPSISVVSSLEKVEEYELIKLRLLNASHSALAYLAFLAGKTYVHEVIADPLFRDYISGMMHDEVKPLLPRIAGVDIDQYCESVLSRFANPSLKDEITRLCLNGSGKLPQFIMPSIAEQIRLQPPTGELKKLTLAVAAWFRYLTGVGENGVSHKIDDPMAAELQQRAREGGEDPTLLLGVKSLFGDDLRGDERFVGELKRAMKSLYEVGARRTLELYV
jgi:mannitol 2-dehydrogenase